ncbi:solute carrier family 53 member 1-like isoform X2 [Tubulanus polymorphus]|uniref:solute carrier family 53 member 1-like isoform X2 n=1 Tax=Tubulanus polymorphus TaxID=672921 RepID=UPI003DA5224A
MKFAEHLGAHITPEWRKQYINYEKMKEMLYKAQEEQPSPEESHPSAIERYLVRFHDYFLHFCQKELAKINTFFSEKLAEAIRKYSTLKAELMLHQEAQKRNKQHHHGNKNKQDPSSQLRHRSSVFAVLEEKEQVVQTRKMHDLKLAFSEFYLSLILLQNYQTLNFTGFRKILKKHDKLYVTDLGSQWRMEHVEPAPFYTSKDVDQLISKVEALFTNELEGGNRQKAMKRLRVPPLTEQQNPWTTFRVGFYIGVFVVLISILCISAPLLKIDVPWVPALIMYRGTFLIVFFLALISGNTYGWRTSGVNHVLIFEIDPRNHLSHQELLEMAGFFGVIWGLSVIGYLFSSLIHIPVFANPLALVAFYVIYLLNPIKILHYKARFWLLRVLFRIFTAPFHYVSFPDFWLADQLNSLAVIMQDFEFFICYYAFEVDWLGADRPEVCNKVTYGIRPLVALLPAWFRFAQCLRRYRDTKQAFPHLVNAGKYSTTFFVVVFSSLNKYYIDHHGDHWKQINAFFYLWIASCIVSSCYTYTWDIKMDWGLFDKNAGENRFLREEIVYAYKGYYYFGIIEDFILRFAWSITVSVGEGGLIHGEILKTVLAVFEVVRRFIWNFFRLENEHLNNCGQFRAVRDISITPIHANDQALLENMMDNDDGVQNRMKHKKKKTRQRSRTYKPVEVEPHRWPSNRRRSSKYLLEDDPET